MEFYNEDKLNGEGLIWGSEVQIEIASQENSERSSIFDPFGNLGNAPVSVNGANYARQATPLPGRQQVNTPSSTGEDADDEGSIHVASPPPQKYFPPTTDARGRPRSRTKQLRRQGLDLSRDDLRISSRWTSSEKRSMEDFREAIREKAKHKDEGEPLFTRWSTRRGRPSVTEAVNVNSEVAKSLRVDVSRGRFRHAHHDIIRDEALERPPREYRPNSRNVLEAHVQKPTGRLRQVHSSISLRRQSPSPFSSSEAADIGTVCTNCVTQDTFVEGEITQTSWQRHLKDDLQPLHPTAVRHKKAKYLLQEDAHAKKNAYDGHVQHRVLPSEYYPNYREETWRGTSTKPLLQPSTNMASVSDRSLESYWRLPSARLSTFQPPLDCSQISDPFPAPSQRLDEIVSSREYDSAWWRKSDGNRNTSASSSQPVTSIASRGTSSQDMDEEYMSPSAELTTMLKAHLANAPDEYERMSSRPLLQPSAVLAMTDRHKQIVAGNVEEQIDLQTMPRYYDNISGSRIASKRLASSISMPDTSGLSVTSRYSSYGDNCAESDTCESRGTMEAMRYLSLYPLDTRIPVKNIVRPSAGRWNR